jgi:hypothetical protein
MSSVGRCWRTAGRSSKPWPGVVVSLMGPNWGGLDGQHLKICLFGVGAYRKNPVGSRATDLGPIAGSTGRWASGDGRSSF